MNIFEGFEYYGAWFKKMNVKFADNDFEVDVQLSGYDEEEKPEKEIVALESFLSEIDSIHIKIGDAVLKYYQNRRTDLGYDVEANPSYPEYTDSESVIKTLSLIGITIPNQEDYDERAVFLVFDCEWDKENGVGVRLVGEDVNEVGIQGIGL